MGFGKRTIAGVKPRDLLLAQLPVPDLDTTNGWVLWVRSDGTACEHTAPSDPLGLGRMSHIAVDQHDDPVALHLAREWPLLIDPPVFDLSWDKRIIAASRLISGAIQIEHEPRVRRWQGVPRAVREDPARQGKLRPVTFDTSVLLTGLRPALFKATDRLFASTAVMQDVAGMHGFDRNEPRDANRRVIMWFNAEDLLLPVAPGSAVWATIKYALGQPDLSDEDEAANLDFADVIAAGTALAYDSPLYTVKPEAYQHLGGGLKVIEYGPVRYRYPGWQEDTDVTPVVVGQRGAYRGGPDYVPPVYGPPPLYSEGDRFELKRLEALRDAEGSNELALTLSSLFGAPGIIVDDTWLRRFLRHSDDVAKLLERADDEANTNLVRAVWSVTASMTGRSDSEALMDLVRNAIANLGRWPQDFSEDLAFDLENDEEFAEEWYPVFLAMAGLSPEAIDEELGDVAHGESQPSAARINELAARQEDGR